MIISKTSSNINIIENIKKPSTVVGTMIMVSILITGNQTVTLKNDVVIEENIIKENGQADIYKSNTNNNCIFYNLPSYTNSNDSVEKVDNIVINEEKVYNLNKLDKIAELQDNWNNNDAAAFSENLIRKVKYLVSYLDIQPEIFPTACDTLQLEYDKIDGSHLEIEIGEYIDAEIFLVKSNGDEKFYTIKSDLETINKVVKEFYG